MSERPERPERPERSESPPRPRKQPRKLTARRVLFQWRFPVIIVIILIILCCIPVGVITRLLSRPKPSSEPDSAELYQQAVYDTLLAESHELPANMSPPKPLVTLDPASTGVEHDENGRVLLCMWHSFPTTYPAGADVTLSYGNITAVSLMELSSWYSMHKAEFTPETADLRLQQVFGLPPLSDESSKNTHFTVFWVNPESVTRPAYSSDVMSTTMTNSFVSTPDEAFYDWFAKNALYMYATINQAWTRMGYTYDWYPAEESAKDTPEERASRHFGLTEFLIGEKQIIHVVSTTPTATFLHQLAAEPSMLSDSESSSSEPSN